MRLEGGLSFDILAKNGGGEGQAARDAGHLKSKSQAHSAIPTTTETVQ